MKIGIVYMALSLALALAVVVTMLAVPAVTCADPGATLSVTGDDNSDVDYPGEVDSHFSNVTIPHNPSGQITVAGKVELGGFEAAPANTVWYELGLVSDYAYSNVDRIHNKGVYMIALWDGTNYQVHIQNVPGVKPDAVGNYLGTGDCYFTLSDSTFLFTLHYYGPITSTDGKVELWVSEGDNWDNIQGPKQYKYAETDVEDFYSLSHEDAVAYGYAADDDFTAGNARIVSQLFTGGMDGATDGQTFTATYDDIASGSTYYELSPRDEEEEEPGGCFIATAVYGTSSTTEIDVLRAFRDEALLENAVGSQLVEWYYQTSPPVADFISGNSLLRTIVRELLVDPIASLVGATETMWGD